MTTQLMNVLDYMDNTVSINLEYDDVTLAVAAIESQNSTAQPCWVQITNPQTSQTFATTLVPGANQRQTLPAGALTLVQVPAPAGQPGTVLSFAPWNIQSRYPAT